MPSAYQHTLQFDNDYKDQCRRLHYLVSRQRELCALSKNMLAIVSKGKPSPFYFFIRIMMTIIRFQARKWAFMNAKISFLEDIGIVLRSSK